MILLRAPYRRRTTNNANRALSVIWTLLRSRRYAIAISCFQGNISHRHQRRGAEGFLTLFHGK